MGNLLGLDLGTKRIGVAVANSEVRLATPLTTLQVRGRNQIKKELEAIIAENAISKIVVGLPKALSGDIGIAAQKVMEEVAWLKDQLSLEWVYWDERLTTAEVDRVLIEADVSRDKRKEIKDSLAAQRILQNYIDSPEGQN